MNGKTGVYNLVVTHKSVAVAIFTRQEVHLNLKSLAERANTLPKQGETLLSLSGICCQQRDVYNDEVYNPRLPNVCLSACFGGGLVRRETCQPCTAACGDDIMVGCRAGQIAVSIARCGVESREQCVGTSVSLRAIHLLLCAPHVLTASIAE